MKCTKFKGKSADSKCVRNLKKVFDDIKKQLIASKRNQIVSPFITVSMAKKLEVIFRESLVIELFWEEKIDYTLDKKIMNEDYKKFSFFSICKKFISKKIRTFIK